MLLIKNVIIADPKSMTEVVGDILIEQDKIVKIAEAQTICQKIGLKFAYNLDGGGSTETILGKKQINTIYENQTGRKVPSFIVFNGTDEYFVPSEG